MKLLSAITLLLPVQVLLSIIDFYPNMDYMLLYYIYLSVGVLVISTGVLLWPSSSKEKAVKPSIMATRTLKSLEYL